MKSGGKGVAFSYLGGHAVSQTPGATAAASFLLSFPTSIK